MDPKIIVEVLTPDFHGKESALRVVLEANPEILNHNLETVERLTPFVRSRAKYRLSLEVLRLAKQLAPVVTERPHAGPGRGKNVFEAMDDLRAANVQVLTMGQYLRPTPQHLPVVEYIEPETFSLYGEIARRKGFEFVASGPLVRSSYTQRISIPSAIGNNCRLALVYRCSGQTAARLCPCRRGRIPRSSSLFFQRRYLARETF